jgi:putative tricarboxylic transport membrane protein
MFARVLAVFLWASVAFAQPYPTKPVRIVVPLVPGGNQDIVARAVAEELAKRLGQQVIVENRPGVAAIVGTQAVKNAAPDGYTLLSVAVTFARVPGINPAAGYDPRSDFTGVSLVCRIPQLLVVNPSFEAHDVRDLVAYARANPAKVSYGSSGNGSTGHVAAELFMRMTGTKLLHVMYKGNAQAIVDLMGGQITMMFDQVSTSMGHVKGGKLRALAVTGSERSPELPDVPSMAEAGFAEVDTQLWSGFFVPAGTPAPIVEKLKAALAKALADPAVQAGLKKMAVKPGGPTGDEFAKRIDADIEKFADVAKAAHLEFPQ